MAKSGGIMEIDISDAAEIIGELRAIHTEENFKKIMYRAFRRTGSKVKTIIKKEVPKDYAVSSAWVGKHIGAPRVQYGGGGIGVQCTIPIQGKRGSIGGQFGASGGAHGWNSKNRKYRVKARILREKQSTLPGHLKHQNNGVPFRNLSAKAKLHGVAFARVGKDRLPIVSVSGLGVPQMPMNRSKDDVQKEIVAHLIERIEHEHNYLISRCK